MTDVSRETILEKLSNIELPNGFGDLVSNNRIENILIDSGKVILSIKASAEEASAFESIRSAAEMAVLSIPGVQKSTAVLTGESSGAPQKSSRPSPPPQKELPSIKNIIAVASGKGGVGKSTTSVNLALSLVAKGLKVGLLDADIYGPSIPRLLSIKDKPQAEGKQMRPIEKHGLKVNSIGFMIEEDSPTIWRGPIATRALSQLLLDTIWGELDALIIDMPPGTGDIHLTLVQQIPLTGAVIVSTPQDIALIDARKGLNMFKRVDVPLIGIIENMSMFVCPSCGEVSNIFGHGGAKEEAEKLGVPFLGAVPLHMQIREKSDAGDPVVISKPESEHSKVYRAIADQVAESVS